jgi:hypothetical protein
MSGNGVRDTRLERVVRRDISETEWTQGMVTREYWTTKDTQLVLDKRNEDDSDAVVTQYEDGDGVTQRSTETRDVGTQRSDLDEVWERWPRLNKT